MRRLKPALLKRSRAWITEEPLRLEGLRDFVSEPGHGAQAVFLGVVRDHHEGRKVLAVTYEAFEPLARRLLGRIAEEAALRWSAKVAVAHRLGRLKTGQASVAIAAASAHRAEAFAACRQTIEEIKARLPVWKKEHYADGESSWLEGCALEPAPRRRP